MEIVSMCKANFLLTIAGGIEYIKFKKATKNPKKYTQKTLRSILTYAKDTVYGKEHDFAYILQAQTDKELFRRFQEKVPTNQYTDLQPYIERHKHGESDVLFPGKPLLYATTSGTTNLYLKISTKIKESFKKCRAGEENLKILLTYWCVIPSIIYLFLLKTTDCKILTDLYDVVMFILSLLDI